MHIFGIELANRPRGPSQLPSSGRFRLKDGARLFVGNIELFQALLGTSLLSSSREINCFTGCRDMKSTQHLDSNLKAHSTRKLHNMILLLNLHALFKSQLLPHGTSCCCALMFTTCRYGATPPPSCQMRRCLRYHPSPRFLTSV